MLTTTFCSTTPTPICSPFEGLEALHAGFDRLLSGTGVYPNFPVVDVSMDGECAMLTAELPGFKTDDIDVSIDRGVLTLSASRKAEEFNEEETYCHRERRSGKFVRNIKLPFGVEAGEVKASYSNGVLTVKLPRLEDERVRRIEVQAI